MTIRTRFGNELEIIKPADNEGWVKVRRVSDNRQREYHASELRCDTDEEQKEIIGAAHQETQ